jgi:four helix bundle protein
MQLPFLKSVSGKEISNDRDSRSQLKRSILSISCNIAEGFEYSNKKDFIRFLRYSKGSSGEVFNLLTVFCKVGYISASEYEVLSKQVQQLGKKLGGFIRYLSSSPN